VNPNPIPLIEKMFSPTHALMARKQAKTIAIKLMSTAGTGFFYTTRKNPSKSPQKVSDNIGFTVLYTSSTQSNTLARLEIIARLCKT